MTKPAPVTMFSTTWCGYCRSLARDLKALGIEPVVVDIEEHPEYGDVIESLTGGFRTVPTVEVCGEYLVNPTAPEVVEVLSGCAELTG